MIHEKWFISDTHFLHANILKFFKDEAHGQRLRDFNSLEDMHNTLIKNWNSVVGKNDYVYHLGDVTFQYNGLFNEIMSQLNGRKRLVHGNHDKIWNPALMRWFEKCELWRGFKEFNFTCTHIPARLDSLRDGAFNVHGHTHARCLDDPHYINVSVEVRNYTPVHLSTLIEEIAIRS